jgi:phage terminase large subunit
MSVASTGISIGDVTAWLKKYRRDLGGFVRKTWLVEPDVWQDEVMAELSGKRTRRIAVSSGHGVGKTALDAWAAIWFVLSYFPCKVILTAPSSTTLEDGLMAEIKMWIARLPPALNVLLEVTADRVILKAAPERAFISAVTARAEKPDALQGKHADYVLIIIDEPSGVPDTVYEASQGSMSGPARFMLLTGNPVYASGFFYRAITEEKGTIWWVREVSCYEAKRSPQTYIDEMEALYGKESNTFRVRVLGLSPTGDEDSFIPLDIIQSAMVRDVQVSPVAPVVWGLDVARLGANQAALAKRKGNFLLEPVTRFVNCDLMQLCGRVMLEYQILPENRRPAEICVDSNGLGAGVHDRLKELGLPSTGINVSEVQAMNPTCFRLRDDLWMRGRAWFASLDCWVPKDPELVKALSCVKMTHHSTGKIMAESKDSLARRLKNRAPRLDAADAFLLTLASTATSAMFGARKLRGRRGALHKSNKGVV